MSLQLKSDMLTPKAYIFNDFKQNWIIDHKVAVFDAEQANVVFANFYPGLSVYGIKNGKAEFFNDLAQAYNFFEENK
jgi:hypothetical protein